MNYCILILAISMLLLGHYFKMLRWRQFVEIYEKPKNNVLLKSLTIGYIVNFCLPFRIGDLIRRHLCKEENEKWNLFFYSYSNC